MSPLARLIGVFISPGETFADIARAPSFLVPLVLVTVTSVSFSALLVNRIGMDTIVRQQMMKNPRMADLPKDQIEQAVERGVKIGGFFTYVGPLVFVPVGILIVAGVLLAMVNFVFGATARFKQVFGMVAHAWIPPSLTVSILGAVILFLKDPADVDMQNLVAANLGVVVSAETSKFLHRMATSIDLFSFWQIALLAMGLSAVTKFNFSKSLVAVVIPWALWVLGAAGLAAAF